MVSRRDYNQTSIVLYLSHECDGYARVSSRQLLIKLRIELHIELLIELRIELLLEILLEMRPP